LAEQSRKRRVYSKSDGESRPSRRLNPFRLLLFLALVLLVFSFYTGIFKLPDLSGFNRPPAGQDVSEARLASIYDVVFLQYVHPAYGFSMRYPTGYAVLSSDGNEALKFFAATGDMNGVLVSVIVSNETFTAKDYSTFYSTFSSTDSGTVLSSVSYANATIGGKNGFLVNATMASDLLDEPMAVNYFLFNCPNYGVIIQSGIPQSVSGEKAFVYHMMESFKC